MFTVSNVIKRIALNQAVLTQYLATVLALNFTAVVTLAVLAVGFVVLAAGFVVIVVLAVLAVLAVVADSS